MAAEAGESRIRGGHYEGPEASVEAPWKCPACGVENLGRLVLGCSSCGSGKPGIHVGIPLPTPPVGKRTSVGPFQLTDLPGDAFRTWITAQAPLGVEPELLLQAFLAGWHAARGQMMTAAPVTADLAALAPAGKSRRTILAALIHFKEHVLSQAEAEITSGEWCSVAEVDQLIAQLEAEESA